MSLRGRNATFPLFFFRHRSGAAAALCKNLRVWQPITINQSWPWRTLSVHNSVLSEAICQNVPTGQTGWERRDRRRRCEDMTEGDEDGEFYHWNGFLGVSWRSARGVTYSCGVLAGSQRWCAVTDPPAQSYNFSICWREVSHTTEFVIHLCNSPSPWALCSCCACAGVLPVYFAICSNKFSEVFTCFTFPLFGGLGGSILKYLSNHEMDVRLTLLTLWVFILPYEVHFSALSEDHLHEIWCRRQRCRTGWRGTALVIPRLFYFISFHCHPSTHLLSWISKKADTEAVWTASQL